MKNLDSKDLRDRVQELANEIMINHNEIKGNEVIDSDDVIEHNATYLLNSTTNMKDEIEELFSILELEDDCGSDKWERRLYLIHEDNLTEYCKALVKGMGQIPEDLPQYLADNIDWQGVANAFKVVYSEVEFQGETYYFID